MKTRFYYFFIPVILFFSCKEHFHDKPCPPENSALKVIWEQQLFSEDQQDQSIEAHQPLYYENLFFIATMEAPAKQSLKAINATTGQVVWSFVPEGSIIDFEIDDGILVLLSGFNLYRIDILTGSKIWEVSAFKAGEYLSIFHDKVYFPSMMFGNNSADSMFTLINRVDITTGVIDTVFRKSFYAPAQDALFSPPGIWNFGGNEYLVFTHFSRDFHSQISNFDLYYFSEQTQEFSFTTLSSTSNGFVPAVQFDQTPIIVDDVMLVNTRQNLYAIDLTAQFILWERKIGSFQWEWDEKNKQIIAFSYPGFISGLNLKTGQPIWTTEELDFIIENPMKLGNKIYYRFNYEIGGIDLQTLCPFWKATWNFARLQNYGSNYYAYNSDNNSFFMADRHRIICFHVEEN